jgi:hypothetical protein
MSAMVIVGPLIAVALPSLDDAAVLAAVDWLVPLDPHAVRSVVTSAVAARNIPILFIVTPYLST